MKTLQGLNEITLVNNLGEYYPTITVEDFVNSYSTNNAKENKYREIESNRWFFNSYDFSTRKSVINEITAVGKETYEGEAYIIKSKLYNKTLTVVSNPDIWVRNIASRKILQVPMDLVMRWQVMFDVILFENDRLVFDESFIEKKNIAETVYTIITNKSEIVVNSTLI